MSCKREEGDEKGVRKWKGKERRMRSKDKNERDKQPRDMTKTGWESL